MPTNERVVVIKGDASKWYSQVVFIMNPHARSTGPPVDLVAEAENIIRDYARRKNKSGNIVDGYGECSDYALPAAGKEHRRWYDFLRFDFILYTMMFAACLVLATLVAVGVMGR